MQIVIDIPEDVYKPIIKAYEKDKELQTRPNLYKAIANGTPLPKGHGRIGDLDQVLLWMIYKKDIIDEQKCGEITPVFKDATIIEAESEDKG